MALEDFNIRIALLLAVGFSFATVLGYLARCSGLTAIIGYLLAGYLIGPYSPGFVANLSIAEQLAEIGVILMMFGVGLHFKWQELVKVKNVALPGAIFQTLITSLCAMALTHSLGWSLSAGFVVGLSVGVASTIVMMRVLSDNTLLTTPQGHIAVGWLLVEDLVTVLILLLLNPLADSFNGKAFSFSYIAGSLALAILKCVVFIGLMFFVGFRVVSFIFLQIARTRSQELFTLAVLSLTFGIAIGSALLFGTSIALGAFIAGMVVGQTDVRHQAFAYAQPLKDAFAVIFFLSIGMLFNPAAISAHFTLFLGILAIILFLKPLVAYLIMRFLKYPVSSALVVAVALAQIGEFSFILSEEAMRLHILPDDGYDVIVACALISIALNNLIFKSCGVLKHAFTPPSQSTEHSHAIQQLPHPRAIVVGFGPIGQATTHALERLGFIPIIIENNVDTISILKSLNRIAIFGDASLEYIQEAAQIQTAVVMAITFPDVSLALSSIKIARKHNPQIKIFARANYIEETDSLQKMGVEVVCNEAEARNTFTQILEDKLRGIEISS